MNKLTSYLKFSACFFLFSLSQVALAASTDEALAREILVYINQYRVQHGLSKLAMNATISQEAAQHSQAMAQHVSSFGHDGFGLRIQHLQRVIPQASNGAENVAYNYKTAKVVVDGWINSPGHRRNILGHYNLTGIGIARDSAGRPYYTQLFLKNDQPIHLAAQTHTTIRHRHEGVFRKLYRNMTIPG